MTEDVAIVGAGPTGLMLACELCLAATRPVILEQLAEPTGLSKALGLAGRSLELLDRRGLLDRFREGQPAAGSMAGLFHFGGIPIDARRLKDQPKFLFIPQAVTERLLEARARELGAEIRRGQEVIGLNQSPDGVDLTVRSSQGERVVRARFVVGCDGGHSVVRKLAGIAFPGAAPTRLLRLGDVKIAAPAEGLSAWRSGRPPFPPLDDGYYRVITVEPYPPGFDRDAPMTLAELSESVRRTTGNDVPLIEPRWLSRFTDASRQAERYRAGRVLLAGDAAHIQLPAGGPGLQIGLGDAVNLGWKLGAASQGWAPAGLLDSYHAERHPVGARVLMYTRAQGALLNPGEQTQALRQLFGELLQDDQTLRRIVDLLQGNDVRYPMGDTNETSPWVGTWAPDLVLTTQGGSVRLAELMHRARGLLIDLADEVELRELAAEWRDRIEVVAGTCTVDPPAAALLIRPDGYIAWAGTEVQDLDHALWQWFGAPARSRRVNAPGWS
jgi:2-polyprenyl-6-methoxyphenol hydroxylase-like FAD-dependent oxidoreductase